MKLAQVLHVPTAYLYCEDDDLASVLLSWGQLKKAERKRVRLLIETELSDRS
jgi:hypothetical protein